jgi:hypothetical protein
MVITRRASSSRVGSCGGVELEYPVRAIAPEAEQRYRAVCGWNFCAV